MNATDPQQAAPLAGSCLCGAIRFEVRGAPFELLHCHCRMCQKAHGAAYASFVLVRHDDFVLLQGEDRLVRHRSSDWATRTFCGDCGSALQFVRDERESFGLAVSALDSRIEDLPERQYCTDTRAPWMIR